MIAKFQHPQNRLFVANLLLFALAAPLSAASAQGGPDAFWQRFVNEVPNGDAQALATLVRKNQSDAIWALARQAQSFHVNNKQELGENIEKLIAAWKEAVKNSFLDKYFDDLRSLDQGQWNEWNRSLGRYNGLMAADQKRRKNELDEEKTDKFAAEALDLAGVFEAIGDRYLATDCYYWAGAVFDPEQRPKGFDLAKCIEHYEKAVKLREALDLKDSFYTDLAAILEKHKATLKKGGAPKPDPKEKDKPKAGGGPSGPGSSSGDIFAKGSAWVAANAKFQAAPPDEIERPGWNTDGNYIDWLVVSIDGKPSATLGATLPFFAASKEAKFIREDSAKYLFDPGDKNLVPLKLGRPMTFEFKIPAGGGVEYAMTAAVGSNQESFHGSTINYAPNENRAPLLYTSSASRIVELGGQKLRIFDDNCDGKFGSEPLSLKDYKGQFIGNLPFLDSVLYPGGKRAMPFSSVTKLGAKWYRLKGDSEQLGVKFQVRELDIKTGTLKVSWNGPAAFKPHYLIFGETTEYQGAFYDLLAGGDKGLEVPAGEYQFFYGVYRNGKGRNYQKYAIVNGESPKKYKVDPGQTVEIKLGGPFVFGHKASMDANDITVPGKGIEIDGVGGERYVMLSDETPRPKVEWRKPGTKGGTVAGEMKRVELKSGESPDLLLFPADLKVKRPDPGPIEFRLVEEHKWFGPVATDWIK